MRQEYSSSTWDKNKIHCIKDFEKRFKLKESYISVSKFTLSIRLDTRTEELSCQFSNVYLDICGQFTFGRAAKSTPMGSKQSFQPIMGTQVDFHIRRIKSDLGFMLHTEYNSK